MAEPPLSSAENTAATPSPSTSGTRSPSASSRLGRAAWWCLAAWPFTVGTAALVLHGLIGQALQGAVDVPRDNVESDVLTWFVPVMFLVPPLSSLALSSLDYRRTGAWAALRPGLVLLALATVWDAWFVTHTDSWGDANWWVYVPSILIALMLGFVILWPRPNQRLDT